MLFEDVETERRRKIETLFSDRVQEEVDALTAEVEAVPLGAEDRRLIEKALTFALDQKYGTRRIDRYYVTHPIRVCRFTARVLPSDGPCYGKALVMALIHNAIEKKVYTVDELAREYDPWIGKAVEGLTQDRPAMRTVEGRRAYYDRLFALDPEVQAIKVLDKLDNLFIICVVEDPSVRSEYLAEAEEHVIPLAERVLPELAPYLRELLANNRRIGYRAPPSDEA